MVEQCVYVEEPELEEALAAEDVEDREVKIMMLLFFVL